MMLPETIIEKLQKTGNLANDHEHDLKMPTDYITHWMYTRSNSSHSLKLIFPPKLSSSL